MKSHTLDFQLALDGGQISAELRDPNGNLWWSEIFEGPTEFDETFDVDLVVGDWFLTLEIVDASGNYRIYWEGHN